MSGAADERPNIVLVVADQHRWSALGHAGNVDLATPAFDRMAAEGTRCTACVSSAPLCVPFRAILQTGLPAWRTGMTAHRSPPIDPRLAALAPAFAAAGWRTVYIGKSHWSGTPSPGRVDGAMRLGWETFIGHNRGHWNFDMPAFDAAGERIHPHRGRFEPEVQTSLALDLLRGDDGRPAIVQLNWGPPHNLTPYADSPRPEADDLAAERLNRELRLGLEPGAAIAGLPQGLLRPVAPPVHVQRYRPEAMHLDPNVEPHLAAVMRYHYADYYAMVSSLDEQLARLLDGVRALARPTVVLYTSDHGDLLGVAGVIRGKATAHQNACRVPLLAWGHGIRVGGVVDAPIASEDLLPTLCGLGRVPVPAPAVGGDRSDWLRAPAPVGDAPPVLMGLDGWRAIWDGRWWLTLQARDRRLVVERLIDTANDPWDRNDRQHAEPTRVDALRDQLVARARAWGDPLAEGA